MFNILVAEDDRGTRLLMKAVLEGGGYNVITAENGSDALEVLAHEHVDLIVLDVMMPVMDGYEATRIIRSLNHPLSKSIPIIAQTANAFQEDIKKVKEVGMNAHISKPIDEENLLKVLAQFKK